MTEGQCQFRPKPKKTERQLSAFGRNRNSAERDHLPTFGAETETEAEFQSASRPQLNEEEQYGRCMGPIAGYCHTRHIRLVLNKLSVITTKSCNQVIPFITHLRFVCSSTNILTIHGSPLCSIVYRPIHRGELQATATLAVFVWS